MDATETDLHRHFAVAAFNRSWELIDLPHRSPEEQTELILAVAASRWHWGHIGGPKELATGDWQVAHAASILGIGGLAISFASRNLAIALNEGWDGWRLASAYEGMARACAVTGDAEGRAQHLEAAQAALDTEPDSESRQLIADQMASVPPC